uniref:Uncharacterized protein n=1 Tax=Trichogramma kaykai TaxID=54128 RepID=A0ABD2VWU9_9HYME
MSRSSWQKRGSDAPGRVHKIPSSPADETTTRYIRKIDIFLRFFFLLLLLLLLIYLPRQKVSTQVLGGIEFHGRSAHFCLICDLSSELQKWIVKFCRLPLSHEKHTILVALVWRTPLFDTCHYTIEHDAEEKTCSGRAR